MQSLSRFLVVGISILTCGPLLAQSTATVAFPNNVARKVGLSGGETAEIEFEVVVDIRFKRGGGPRPQIVDVIEFIGITESGAMIAGIGDFTLDEPKGRRTRSVGDGGDGGVDDGGEGDGGFLVETGKIDLSALLVIHLNDEVFEIESGTLEFMRVTLFP